MTPKPPMMAEDAEQVEAGQDVAASMLAMACWRAALDQNQGNAK
jgi:hypothetical protein